MTTFYAIRRPVPSKDPVPSWGRMPSFKPNVTIYTLDTTSVVIFCKLDFWNHVWETTCITCGNMCLCAKRPSAIKTTVYHHEAMSPMMLSVITQTYLFINHLLYALVLTTYVYAIRPITIVRLNTSMRPKATTEIKGHYVNAWKILCKGSIHTRAFKTCLYQEVQYHHSAQSYYWGTVQLNKSLL